MVGAWPIYLGPVGVNLSVMVLAILVLVLSLVEWARKGQSRLLEVSLHLFLVGFLFVTLHGRILQSILPISLPEKPLVDNFLTLNYALSNALAYVASPIL